MNSDLYTNLENSRKEINPDIIIEFSPDDTLHLPVVVIYVRPETNIVSYEKSIIKGIAPFGNVIYMANLNGKLFIKDALILEHYASQYRFAIFGRQEIEKYTEMIDAFEKHFNDKFDSAQIIGSFEAILKLEMKQQELFNVFVHEGDFLRLYGQTIKKIKDVYVVNYDIPALIEKYNPKTNVFVIALRFKNDNISFTDINQSISEELKKNNNSPLLKANDDKFDELNWVDILKRTYHISNSHVMALFDMKDFVFKSDGSHLKFSETPLGYKVLQTRVTVEMLKSLKEYPIVYVEENGKKKLINIIEEACNKTLDECVELVNRIIW